MAHHNLPLRLLATPFTLVSNSNLIYLFVLIIILYSVYIVFIIIFIIYLILICIAIIKGSGGTAGRRGHAGIKAEYFKQSTMSSFSLDSTVEDCFLECKNDRYTFINSFI